MRFTTVVLAAMLSTFLCACDDESVPQEEVLIIKFNLAAGSARILDLHGVYALLDETDCPLEGGYYTCRLNVETEVYTVVFTEVDGYATPLTEPVQPDNKENVVVGDYEPLW